jgi:AcrR family transcriptional regulator
MSATAETTAKDERRREILDAAFVEFAAKGYAGASMEAIARRARASKETLYAWFQNKETLFNTLVAARIDALASRVGAAALEDPSPAHVLEAIARDVIRLMLATEPLSRAMGAGEPSEKALQLVGRTISEWRGRFVGYLEQCRAAGQIAFDDDPFELASLFVAMAEGEFSLRLATGMLDEVTEAMIDAHARRVTRIFLKALAPG